ncbi:Geranylgeranyltransferase [Spraguea lophii 42_110]|uniref:Geranylgeranyl transferase type II subunit beta n=1 Tax=Spraguea lophii (strain 42_110) TaxID=1358809 RepID=S7W6Y6_SPRLO|nr:Geranylgeranyltransferase [Spraguea lophii 42_110]
MFYKEKIKSYILKCNEGKEDLSIKKEFYKIKLMYFVVTSLKLLCCYDEIEKIREGYINYILNCKNSDGGYGPCVGYPSHVFSTFFALLVLRSLNYNSYDKNTIEYLKRFKCRYGDDFGEEDNRFTIAALGSLFFQFEWEGEESDFLYFLKINGFDINSIEYFILDCYNKDGGFGLQPQAESHLAQTYCSLGSLSILGFLDCVDKNKIIKFILLRQQESGGFNGRANKKEDTCYSFYGLSSLKILDSHILIDKEKLINFILSCHNEDGGFTDMVGNPSDIYHTCYSLLALSILEVFDLGSCDHVLGLALDLNSPK